MGKYGSEWRHGYIPENAAAVALKMHKKPSGGSSSAPRTGHVLGAFGRKDNTKSFEELAADPKHTAATSTYAIKASEFDKSRHVAVWHDRDAQRVGPLKVSRTRKLKNGQIQFLSGQHNQAGQHAMQARLDPDELIQVWGRPRPKSADLSNPYFAPVRGNTVKPKGKGRPKVAEPKPKQTRTAKAAAHTAHKAFSGKAFLKTHEQKLLTGFQSGYGITATGKIDKATKAHLAKVVAGHKGDPNYARAAALLALANGNKAKAAKILRNRHVRDQRIKHGKRVKGRLNEASRKQEKAAGASWGPFDKQHSHHGWAGGNDPASNGKSGKKAGAKAQKGGKK